MASAVQKRRAAAPFPLQAGAGEPPQDGPAAAAVSTPRNGDGGKPSPSFGQDALGLRELILMVLLSVQTGAQPIITKSFTSRDVIVTTQVISCEFFKVILAALGSIVDGSWKAIIKTWRPAESVFVAAVPAAIYALQNMLIQVAYRHVDAVTFNLLNQTKLISTAFCNYFFLRKPQSRQQVVALCLMLTAAFLLTMGNKPTTAPKAGSAGSDGHYGLSADTIALGIIPLFLASMTSGLGSCYCQWLMQNKGRNPHLFTMEMCSLSMLVLLASLLTSADGGKVRNLGFFFSWTPLAVIPPLANAIGGIFVGLVTKYAGGVRKGFTMIFGLLVAALLQYFVEGIPLSSTVWVAFPLVIVSTYLHANYPHKATKLRTE